MASGLTPKLPLTRGETNDFVLITTYQELVRQNFKNLLLTNPGERVMDIGFGVGLYRYLFENDNQLLYSKVAGKIREQVTKYLPYIEVVDIIFDSARNNPDLDTNFLKVKISYNIIPLETSTEIEITLPTD
jgi:phage baseplate assembly protein W